MSSQFRELALSTLLPAIPVLIALGYDITSSTGLPNPVRSVQRKLCAPFRNFLTLKDLPDGAYYVVLPTDIKTRLLICLACLEMLCWLSYFAYAAVQEDVVLSVRSLVGAMSWVRA